MPTPLATILLLTLSNIFMTFAWYGHLKYKSSALWIVILVSWGIAFFEYCLQVPANRMGHGYFSAAQLKTIQEIIMLVVFCVFSYFYLGEQLRWNHAVGFAFIILAAFFIFKKWQLDSLSSFFNLLKLLLQLLSFFCILHCRAFYQIKHFFYHF